VKPIRLTLQNFGPYAGEPVVVDFQELDPVFLICGDTGAGKTSLFDGMCYALYGEPLGTRSDKSLRSNVAREGESTLAEFEFEVRGTRYLARRSPNWFTPKLRGGGFRSEEIHLLLAKGEVLAARTRDMTERVEAILGLTHGEFAKILVLPQGEFQRFLEMNTADREGILQKLFPIQEHKRLTDLAKARAEQSRRTLQGIQSQLKEAAGEAALDEAQGEARALELEERLRTSVQDEAEALKLRDAALERLREGRSLAQAFAEQDRLRQDEAAFQAARTQRDALDQEFQLARRAAACEGQVTRLADTQTALDQAQAEQSSTRNQLGEAKARRGSLQPALDALPERQRRLEALKGQDALGGKQLDDLTEIGKAWRASQEAARKLAGAEAVLATRDQEAAAAKQCIEALDAVEAERGLLQARLDGLAPLKGKMDRLQGDAGTVRAWPELERQLEAEVASGAMAASAAAATLRDEEARVERLRLHRESNLAAALAASLGEGDPCPVCGSSHHPRLARPAAESDPASWTLEPRPRPPRRSTPGAARPWPWPEQRSRPRPAAWGRRAGPAPGPSTRPGTSWNGRSAPSGRKSSSGWTSWPGAGDGSSSGKPRRRPWTRPARPATWPGTPAPLPRPSATPCRPASAWSSRTRSRPTGTPGASRMTAGGKSSGPSGSSRNSRPGGKPRTRPSWAALRP
jgi:exonuclease SbcC